ncbi:MAG TPA: carbon storage regulator [Pirellulales bacterium]|jgi:carbon storage regulator|nr:carbon storage regulator [Pirellulales bacterium]
MIVISRLAGEAVVVGHEITVTVVHVEGDEVLLHIDAPEGSELECCEDLANFSLASKTPD